MSYRETGWIQTFTGRKVFPLDPRPEDIDIVDVAHHLAAEPRFSGATRSPYSVAQHSVYVCQETPEPYKMEGLLHDFSEYILRDIPRPLKEYLRKNGIRFYDKAEERVEMVGAMRFGLTFPWPDVVKKADIKVLVTESRDLFDYLQPDWKYQVKNGYEAMEERIVPWDAETAERVFLDTYMSLLEK